MKDRILKIIEQRVDSADVQGTPEGMAEEILEVFDEASILYVADGEIHTIGPFPDEDQAMAAGQKAQADGEFDVWEQHVYLLKQNKLLELSGEDLDDE